MEPISIALALAQFAPTLLRFFGAGEKSATVAEKVIDIAKQVTGAPTPELSLELLKMNQEAQLAFQTKILENETTLEKAFLEDRKDARARDIKFIESGKQNIRANILVLAVFLLVVGITFAVWTDPTSDEFVKGVFTLILGRATGWLDQVFQFEFGTTRTSKVKDETISSLSRNKEE